MPVYPSGGTIAQSVGSPGFGPAPTPSYNASASVRLNPADTANISFNPTIEGSRTTWTLAFWAKRSLLATRQFLVSNYNLATTVGFVMEFDASDRLDIYDYTNPTYSPRLITTQVFRDVGAWYHFTVVLDTTQATNTNRFKLFVNGVQVTAFSTATYPAQFYQGNWNRVGFQSTFGKAGVYTSGTLYLYGGYFADMNFVDGLALTPSSFTATDANTGQLVPAQYTGSFGRNGCYLPFSGAALAVDLGQNPKTTGQDFPYWPYSTLLVNTTSTNGAQNNTFLDSSTNNFTITRNGNTTQGNFTPFNFGGGTTQANGYYSGYFDGTGDYLNFNGTTLNVGTGSFTLEGWVYITSYTFSSVISTWNSLTAPVGFILGLDSSGRPFFSIGTASGAGSSDVLGANAIPLNVWTHLAATKTAGSGGTMTLYVNGVSVGTNTTTRSVANTAAVIGRYYQDTNNYYLNGYISNVRVVTGSVVYASNFTVPTTPLTAISGTQVLTCQSSQFIDNSANAFAITANGNAQPLPTNPFGMTAWSGYFDGTGDYLTVPSATATTLDADFTIEYFMYRPAAGNNWILTLGDAFLSSGIETYIGTSGTAFNLYSNNAVRITSSTLPAVGVWSHVAMVRSGSTVTLYLNGVSLGTWTSSATFSGITYIGAERYNGSITGVFTGYLSNVRIVKGTAVYTANFTPPTATLTAISGTSLLTCQSSTFIDNSPNAFAITVNGNPYTLTLNNPFNSPVNTTPPVQAWSNYFEGTSASVGGGLTFPSSSNFAMGTGDFTIEGWYFPNRVAEATTPINIAWYIGTINGANAIGGGVATNEIHYRSGASNQITLVTNVTGWNHVAWVRQAGVVYVYLNGIRVASASAAASVSAGTMIVARPGTDSFRFSGWISNMRVVKGRAVYNANFTPSNTPLGYVDGTVLLTCQSNNFADNSLFRAVPTINTPANISPSSPFFPTQAWSAASYGGTMYFDGSGDYLDTPSNAALALGTVDFTIQFWVWFNSHKNFIELIDARGGVGTTIRPVLYSDSAGILYYFNDGSNRITSGALPSNSWIHIALTRSGTSTKLFVNGAQSGSTYVDVSNYTQAVWRIGSANNGVVADTTNYSLPGYISGLQVLKGTALYTTPFVPPVLPPTNISNTSLLLNATNSGVYDATGKNVIYTVDNAQVSTAVKKWGTSSVYFDGSGDYLAVEPSVDLRLSGAQTTATNKDFTIETWIYPTTIAYPTSFGVIAIKRGSTGTATGYVLSVSSAGALGFNAGDGNTAGWELALTSSNGAIAANNWYHVAVTRQGTTFRMFINGVQVATSSPTAFVIAYDITGPLHIGLNAGESPLYPWYGYMQDFRYTIGAARYQGNFTPPAAAFAYNQYDIGNQQWSPNNISVTAGVGQDNLVDSPSDYGTDTGLGAQVRGNYATMSPIDTVGGTFANGNLDVGVTAAAGRYIRATIAPPSGKWYWEATVLSTTGTPSVGVAATTAVPSGGVPVIGVTYSSNAVVTKDSTNLGTQTAWSVNNVVGIAYDADNLTIALYLNNALQTTVNLTTGYTYAPLFMSYANVTATSAVAFNFGQRAFAYAAPSGFKCLVSTNLPTVNGIGATSSTQATDYINPLIYTGNDVSGRTITGVGFQPDLVWIKARNQAYSNQVTDVVRGPSKALLTNSTSAELPNRTVGYVSAFASDGFTVTAGSTDSAEVNQSGTTYVAWNWKANGAGVANTAGTIPSTVSANTTSGCSIITYTGNASSSQTIGHGLGVAPKFVIIKERTGTWSWMVYHEKLTANNYLILNGSQAQVSNSQIFIAAPTSTVINIGNNATVNNNGSSFVAYAFAPINGFSATGSYIGNGSSTQGAFVYTGFRPAFVMIKAMTSAYSWVIYDDARNPSNLTNLILIPDSSGAEITGVGTVIDMVSNGFIPRNAGNEVNASSVTYVYIAFAEFPFKYSRAR